MAVKDDSWRDDLIKEIDTLQTRIDENVKIERTFLDHLSRVQSQLKLDRAARDRFLHRLRTGHTGVPRNGQDPMVVLTEQFGPLLRQYLEQGGYGSVAQLSRQSGIGEKHLRRIRDEHHTYTSVWVVEDLLMAMGCEEWLSDGTLKIVPNPMIMQHRRRHGSSMGR